MARMRETGWSTTNSGEVHFVLIIRNCMMLGRLRFVLLGLATVLFVDVRGYRDSQGHDPKASNAAVTLRGLKRKTGNARKLQELMCPGKKNVPSPTTTAGMGMSTTVSHLPKTTTTPPTTTTTPPPPSITTFCVVADAPYRYEENLKLTKQVDEMDPDCEFVAHLGDIRSARKFDTCMKETYTNASSILRRSKKPVLMMLGDNEWNDCPNHKEALQMWHKEFDNFPNEHWEHDFNITSQSGRVENMHFVHKQALFITLNIVGYDNCRGRVVNQAEWNDRLTNNFKWTKQLIETHVVGDQSDANVVVIMAHATNSPNHRPFFHALRDYIDFDLKNKVPILYLNGDTHAWNEQMDFYEQPNWKRVTVQGNAVAKPLKLSVHAHDGVSSVNEAFSFVRFY